MADLISIPGIGKVSLELLDAAGFYDVESLADAKAEDLTTELARANAVLKICKRAPELAKIEKWIENAREIVGVDDDPEDETPLAVNYENSPEVASMLSTASFAIPLPARIMVENQLAVSDIPPAILLNRYSGDLEVRTEKRLPSERHSKPVASSGYVQIADAGGTRPEFDASKVRSISDMAEPLVRMAAVKVSPSNDRLALLRAPRSATNKGRSPESHWYIRGVLHSHPVSVYVGAFVTVLLLVTVPVALVSAGLLLLSAEQPEEFSWVPGWLIVFPVVLPLLGISYLIWGLTGACRICGQKLFTHRSHLKNSRAHHIRGLGYIFPLCFQILIFRWFRCTHCGTPVRLKE